MKNYYCYILANQAHGTLYVGVTSDLLKRVYQHRTGTYEGFSQKYEVNKLVWFEAYSNIEDAILREKRIKKWNRDWKIQLIESKNPAWDDLYPELVGSHGAMDSRFRGNDISVLT